MARPQKEVITLRRGSGVDEDHRRVRLPSCSSLGYSWALEYAGGYALVPSIRPTLLRNGKAVEWNALEPTEQRELAEAMGARLGSPNERSLGALFLALQKVEAFAGIKPITEGRVLIEGALFFGARVKKLKSFLGRDIYSLSLGPTGSLAPRTHPTERLWVHDSTVNRSVLLFEMSHGSWDRIEPIKPHGMRVTFPTKHGATVHYLYDLKNGLSHPLTAQATPEEAGYIAVEESGTRRVAWFRDGSAIAIDYAELLSTAGAAGLEKIAPHDALAWGEAHRSLTALLTVYLLSTHSKEAVRAALARFPGWKPATGEVVVRGAARIVVRSQFVPDVSEGTAVRLGTFGAEAFLLWPAPDEAIIAVPQSRWIAK